MAVFLPNGAVIHIASAYGALKAMTAVTNANPAVATLAALHGVAEGDVLEVTSGWESLDGRIVKAGPVDTNDVDLAGINTSSTAKYLPGDGVGSVREISTWTRIMQVTENAVSGGEQGFVTYGFLEQENDHEIPTRKSPIRVTITIADDPSLAFLDTVETADDERTVRAIRITMKSGAQLFYSGYVSISPMPVMNKDQIMTRTITISLVAQPTRYAA